MSASSRETVDGRGAFIVILAIDEVPAKQCRVPDAA